MFLSIEALHIFVKQNNYTDAERDRDHMSSLSSILINIKNKFHNFITLSYFQPVSAELLLVKTNGKCMPRLQSILILKAIIVWGFRVSTSAD